MENDTNHAPSRLTLGDGAFVGFGTCMVLVGAALSIHQVSIIATMMENEMNEGSAPGEILGFMIEPMALAVLPLMIAFVAGKVLIGRSIVVSSPADEPLQAALDKLSIVGVAAITVLVTFSPFVAAAVLVGVSPIALGVALVIPMAISDATIRWRYQQVWSSAEADA